MPTTTAPTITVVSRHKPPRGSEVVHLAVPADVDVTYADLAAAAGYTPSHFGWEVTRYPEPDESGANVVVHLHTD